tara:strand:+ start:602 stop:751 length:150 start_codon:yes stop_codon:yes gene_type:complete
MEDKPLSPKWFTKSLAVLAVTGLTIPLIASIVGSIQNELRRVPAIERKD